MTTTSNLDLPYILAAQAQKHVTHNEALRVLDAVVQIGVGDRTLTYPPASPAEGQRHIVAAGATGVWAGHAGSIAAYQDGAWAFYAAQTGWLAWVAAESLLVAWNGSSWVMAGGLPLNPATLVGVNTTADATNKLAVKSNAVLLSHDDVTPGTGDMRAVMNKASAGNTASLLLQTAFSGRAEIGLTGDDNLRLKVSADGATWKEAVVVDKTSGSLGVGATSPQAKIHAVTDSSGKAFLITGIAADGSSDADHGGLIALGHNSTSNRQIVFCDSQSGNGVRFLDRTLDGYNAFTTGYLQLVIGNPSGVRVDGFLRLPSYTVATLPSGAQAGSMTYCSNESGGAVPVFFDGTSWRRVTDRIVAS